LALFLSNFHCLEVFHNLHAHVLSFALVNDHNLKFALTERHTRIKEQDTTSHHTNKIARISTHWCEKCTTSMTQERTAKLQGSARIGVRNAPHQ